MATSPLLTDPAANPLLTDPAVLGLFATLPAIRLVGGCVRDSLVGHAVTDMDLATPIPPEQVMDILARAGIRAIPTGLAHGTVTALLDGRPFEITTLRRDVSTDGRHAAVTWTCDWQEDAARRDFTINAMSLAPDGALHDYFGGAADLQAGRVRFVGDAVCRVEEDYLRILRFFRFQARYGRGEPDAGALAAIRTGLAGLARLSAERVWSELKRILTAPDPDAAIALMAATGVLAALLPEATPTPLAGLPPDPVLRFAALIQGGSVPAATRLKASLAELAQLAALRGPPPDGDDDALRRQLADTDRDALLGRSWLAGQPAVVRARLQALPTPKFPLEGRDVLALGLPPGPAVGELLRQVRAWWQDGGCQASLEACRAHMARLAQP